jgi:hypothetical protein
MQNCRLVLPKFKIGELNKSKYSASIIYTSQATDNETSESLKFVKPRKIDMADKKKMSTNSETSFEDDGAGSTTILEIVPAHPLNFKEKVDETQDLIYELDKQLLASAQIISEFIHIKNRSIILRYKTLNRFPNILHNV